MSTELAPAVAASLAALHAPERPDHPDRPDRQCPAAADLRRYEDLLVRLKIPQQRAAAGDEVYALWEGDPSHFLWMELAKNNDHLLKRRADLDRLGALPVLADTTTAVGAFAAGRLKLRPADRGRMFRKAAQDSAGLDPFQRVWVNAWIAADDHRRGDTARGVRRLVDGLPRARQVGGSALELQQWRQITSLLIVMDRLDDAMHAAALTAELARHCGNRYRELEAQIQRADIREARLELPGALELLEDCARDAEAGGFPWLRMDSLDKAAAVCAELGDYERALGFDRRNLELARDMQDPLNVPRILASMGHDHRMAGRMDSCFVSLESARREALAYGDERNRSMIAVTFAEYHCLTGHYAAADSCLLVAEGLTARAGAADLEARLLLELIPQSMELGRTDLAYRWLARLGELKASLHSPGLEQNLLADYEIVTGRLLAQQGEFRRSAAALARAEAAIAAHGGEGRLLACRLAEGELAQLRQDLDTARLKYDEGLQLAAAAGNAELAARCRFRLGHVLLQQGRFAEAELLFDRDDADTVFGHRFRDRLANRYFLGLTLAGMGRPQEAAALFRSTLDLCTGYSPRDLVLGLKVELGRALVALGSLDEARIVLEEAATGRSAPEQGTSAKALDLIDADSRRDAVELLIGLYLEHPRLLGPRSLGTTAMDLAASCLTLGDPDAGSIPQTAEIAYFVGRGRSFALVHRQDGFTVHPLPGEEELDRMVAVVLADCSTPGREVDLQAARALAEVLLDPVAGLWNPGEVLTVLPDRLLHEVPWSALPLPVSFGGAADRLVLDYGPVVAGAPAAARHRPAGPATIPEAGLPTGRTEPSSLRLLAIGCNAAAADPADPLTGVSPPALRRAEAEAGRIAAMWPVGLAELRTGDQARWAELAGAALPRAQVIHLASHAMVHRGLPERSTLRLAAADGAEPVTVPAVQALNLHAELAFLSCCNAAGGDRRTGGGVSDFAQAFLAAGTRTVIASTNWVDDEASAFLAQEFYRNWLAGMSKAEALRAAQLALRATRPTYRHPSYWSFYRLIGATD